MFRHRRKIPHITDDSPGCHHTHDIFEPGLFRAVPERIPETGIVFHSNGVDGSSDFERPLFEHHHRRIVNASSFGEYEDWQFVWVVTMRFQPRINGFL